MRIAILQLEPELGDVEKNLKQANNILESSRMGDRRLRARSKSRQDRSESMPVRSGSRSKQSVNELQPERNSQQNLVDLLLLPELAFSGSHQTVSTNAEPTLSGPSSMWAYTMSSKFNCAVTVGYPERVNQVTDICYNSAITVYSTLDGSEPIQKGINYRQTRLDYMGQVWASPGTGFWNGNLPDLGNVTIGIGWDIMSKQDDFAFANHIVRNKSDLVIIPMNFPGHAGQEEVFDDIFIRFLCKSLWPVASAERETIVVAANSCGRKGKYTYAGSSAVLGLGNGLVKIYKVLGRGQRSLLIVDTSEIPTYTWGVDDIFKKKVLDSRDTHINRADARPLDIPRQAAQEALSTTPADSELIFSPEAPTPRVTHQPVHDQQEVQSLVNSNIDSLKKLQNIGRQAHAAQQDSLGKIRKLASVKMFLVPVINNGIASKAADSFLSELVTFQVHADRYLREASLLIEELDKNSKSANEHYEEGINQMIEFLGRVELVGIENVVEETADGNE